MFQNIFKVSISDIKASKKHRTSWWRYKTTFFDKNIDEIDFWNEYDIEISSYRFIVEYTIEEIIYEKKTEKEIDRIHTLIHWLTSLLYQCF